MTIRDATSSDADAVYRLLSGFVTSYQPDRAVFDDVTFPRIIETATDGRAEFLVAEQDSRVIGYLLALRMPTLFAGGTILELLELAVDAPVRGRGTGSALILAAQARAREAEDIEVVVPTRRAADFYRRLGFHETAAYLKLSTGRAHPLANPTPPALQ